MSRHPITCVVGAGGREHALSLLLSGAGADVVVTPGNPGMPSVVAGGGRVTVTPAPATEVEADLYVIGPEAPLVAGLADRLRADRRLVVGPGADAARLEGSKAFMKEVLVSAGVPTARHGTFDRFPDAAEFLRTLPGPWVVKTDGLAAGKGVLVAGSLAEAEADVRAKLAGTFGEAGKRVVVEEGLSGFECSLMVLCDGKTAMPLPVAQDFKRIGDGDLGPNTGGMGAYAPVPGFGPGQVGEVMDRVVEPTLTEIRRRGVDYRGVLYAGLMVTEDGPKVLEYNVRLGDPEAQVVLPLLAGAVDDPLELLFAVADGGLAPLASSGGWRTPAEAAVCVVMASSGYPADTRTGDPIGGLGDDGQLATPVPGVTVHHAGTSRVGAGADRLTRPFRTAGGRVLGITAVAPTLAQARRRAYEAAGTVRWRGCQYRRDIGAVPSGVAR